MTKEMKRICLTPSLVFLIAIGSALALADEIDNWRPLKGVEIKAALINQKILYPDEGRVVQEFHTNGSTVYIENGPSFGSWRTTDTQYCSVWPPGSSWVCYHVLISRDQLRIRFIGESGRIYEGLFEH